MRSILLARRSPYGVSEARPIFARPREMRYAAVIQPAIETKCSQKTESASAVMSPSPRSATTYTTNSVFGAESGGIPEGPGP